MSIYANIFTKILIFSKYTKLTSIVVNQIALSI